MACRKVGNNTICKRAGWWLGFLYGEGGDPPFDPGTLNPDLWIDASNDSKYTSSVDFKGRIIDAVQTSDVNAYTLTSLSSPTLRFKPSFNGEGHYLNGATGYLCSAAASQFTPYHNGSPFTMYFTVLPLPVASSSTQWYIARTVGSSSQNTQVGFGFFYRHLTGTAVKTCRFAIYNNGGGATGPFDVTCSNNSLVDYEFNVVKVVFTGTTLTVYVLNSTTGGVFVQKGQDATGSGLVATNPVQSLQYGATGLGFTGYVKPTFGFKRNLNVSDETAIETYLTAERLNRVSVTDANVYEWWGQSNTWGQEPLANLPVDMAIGNNLGGSIYWPTTSAPSNKNAYWDYPIIGSTTHPSAAQFGGMLRFMKKMSLAGADPWLIIKGVGSTKFIPSNPPDLVQSWTTNPSEWVNASDLYPSYRDQHIIPGLEELIHVYRKNPVMRGSIKTQGETDGALAVANTQTLYQAKYAESITNKSALIRGLNTTILTQNPIATSKMRILDARIANYAGLAYADVRAADDYVTANYFTDNPGEVGNVKALSLISTDTFPNNPPHYNAVGYDMLGEAIADYFIPYMNE